jgi:hypothetical protein
MLMKGGLTKVYTKVPDWIVKEIEAYNYKHSLRSNTKDYGSKTHYTDSQNSDETSPSDVERNIGPLTK